MPRYGAVFRICGAFTDHDLVADKGYDSDEFRNALHAKRIKPCIPPRSNRKKKINDCKTLYKQRYKVENTFAKL